MLFLYIYPSPLELICVGDFYRSNTSTTTLPFLSTAAFPLRFATVRHPKSSTKYFSTSRPSFHIPITVALFRLSPLLFHLNKFPSYVSYSCISNSGLWFTPVLLLCFLRSNDLTFPCLLLVHNSLPVTTSSLSLPLLLVTRSKMVVSRIEKRDNVAQVLNILTEINGFYIVVYIMTCGLWLVKQHRILILYVV